MRTQGGREVRDTEEMGMRDKGNREIGDRSGQGDRRTRRLRCSCYFR